MCVDAIRKRSPIGEPPTTARSQNVNEHARAETVVVHTLCNNNNKRTPSTQQKQPPRKQRRPHQQKQQSCHRCRLFRKRLRRRDTCSSKAHKGIPVRSHHHHRSITTTCLPLASKSWCCIIEFTRQRLYHDPTVHHFVIGSNVSVSWEVKEHCPNDRSKNWLLSACLLVRAGTFSTKKYQKLQHYQSVDRNCDVPRNSYDQTLPNWIEQQRIKRHTISWSLSRSSD